MSLVHPENWLPQGITELEERAWIALQEVTRSVCVTAGAGAGKTEFLAQKAAYLLQTGLCPTPKRILAISFKRDAASTLAERVKKRCTPDQSRRFVSLTFDAFSKTLVDQFRMAIPEQYRPPAEYKIDFISNDDLNDFLRRQNINSMNAQQFQKRLLTRKLLDAEQEVSAREEANLNLYWHNQYTYYSEPQLAFPMINRLAEYLLRTNPRIRRAIRISYPFVFLDEFQDTQYSQLEVLRAAFDGSNTKFTAVGDDKQRIMGWAGAMEDAFETFRLHYNARSVSLLLNWRSHAGLVDVQHVIAQNIDPDVEPAVARGARTVAGDISAIWEFPNSDTEMTKVAEWIANEIASGIPAHEIAVLVRARADRIEEELGPALAVHGQPIRNLARNVGSISIEDLLSEDLTAYMMPFLRLGCGRKNANAWSKALENMSKLEGASGEEIELQRINVRTEQIVRRIRSYLRATPPDDGNAAGLMNFLLDEIGEEVIRRVTPSYQRDADYTRVRDGLGMLMMECMADTTSWITVLDRMEGINQVPLLTVHKSKGMEFHTMIFFGLDNRTWWSLTPDRGEEMNSFFVAFTRAQQRAFFTSCRTRGSRIVWLEELLGQAVPRIDGTNII